MKLRVASLIITALVGSFIVAWVSQTTWGRVEALQEHFSELKADSFYLGVRARNRIQKLNDTLLRYRLRGDTNDYEIFQSESRELKSWLEASQSEAITSLELTFLKEIVLAYGDYLVDSTKVLEANRTRWLSLQAKDFQDSYQTVQEQSQHLLSLCDGFIDQQRTVFDVFLQDSKVTLEKFAALLKLSLVLFIMLVLAIVILIYRDMIEPLRHQLTESQAMVARQEKLASLGVLAAGVAHEIRNPLTAIKFRLFSLKKSLPSAGVDNEDAAMIGNEISRLERIVKDFLQFARPSEPKLVSIPAKRLIQEIHDLLRPQLERSQINLEQEVAESLWVSVDTQQIKQVLINLVQNAAESIGRNGAIKLRLRREAEAPLHGSNGCVALDVADTGKGISPEVQKRLFDPFFTTKESGSGLGLPIAARIVEMHGGELRYTTELDRGTVFSIVLPQDFSHEAQNPADRR